MEWLLLPPLALFGVMAGGWSPFSKIASPLIGVCIGLILGVYDWWLIGFATAGFISEKFGVGHPIGYILTGKEPIIKQDKGVYDLGELEKWQPEFTRHSPRTALAIRGVLSGMIYAPLLLIVGWKILLIMPVYVLSWSLTVWPIKNGWKWSEAGRQVVCGSLLILIT